MAGGRPQLLFRPELSPLFPGVPPSPHTPGLWLWGWQSVCPTSKSQAFCLHSNIVRRVSVSGNKHVLYLPSSFLQPDGCPDLCNGNGRCTLGQNSWQCVCQTGWRGPGCNVAMETSCADNKDNEGGERKSSNSQSLKSRGLSMLSSWVISLHKEYGCRYHRALLFHFFWNKWDWECWGLVERRGDPQRLCVKLAGRLIPSLHSTGAHGISWVPSTACRWELFPVGFRHVWSER